MEKITSFTIDHIKLQPGLYVSRKDKVGIETITTFDLRLTKPNGEPVMNTAEMHTMEHLAATYLRNEPSWKDRVIYFGPMGCRTGFYLLLRDKVSYEEAIRLVQDSMKFIAAYEGKIPGTNKIECGNYLEHDLTGAKKEAAAMIPVLEGWTPEMMEYKE
jgi:S-ribosylhomocysteine lyase